MAGKTKIEWTGHTWNPVRGCSRVSEGCRNCYAETLAARFSGEGNWAQGLAFWATRPDGKKEARWTGTVMAAPDHVLTQPLRWKAPRTIFVNSTSDLFHEDLPDEVIDRVFAVMALCPQHTFQVLTKRPDRMRDYFLCDDGFGRWGFIEHRARQLIAKLGGQQPEGKTLAHFGGRNLPNVWLGTSVEDQATADARIPHLLQTPAAIRFISAEPLLGPVDLERLSLGMGDLGLESGVTIEGSAGITKIEITLNALVGAPKTGIPGLDWVICGGESGPGARPMHPDWAQSLRDQCAAADVPFFFKQWGAWAPGVQVDYDFPVWRRGRCQDATWFGERWLFDQTRMDDPECKWDQPADLYRVGKKAAGRLLDGVLHDAMPHTDQAVVPMAQSRSAKRLGDRP